MSRRKARGTLEPRPTGWYLRIRIDGAERRIELGSHQALRSEAAARREADAWLARQHPEQISTGQKIRAAEYFERFLKLEASLYRKTTRRLYQSRVRSHLIPRLGGLWLHQIGHGEIKAFIADELAAGIGRATVTNCRAVLLQLIRQARVDGFDAQEINPRLVRVPRRDAAEKEQRRFEPAELDAVLEACADPWRALYATMGLMGLRIGETLGLSWRHLDLDSEAPLATIRQTAQAGEIAPLKTIGSRSDLPIPPDLVPILSNYRANWTPNSAQLLFATSSGRPLRAENVRRRHWTPLLKRLGLQHAGFHALRHGLPRRLFEAEAGADVVMRLMRHANLRMTQVYTHTESTDLRRAQASAARRKVPQSASRCDTGAIPEGKNKAIGA